MIGASHIAAALGQIQENISFEKRCSEAAPEEERRLRTIRADMQTEALEHRKKLEIAEAGKTEVTVNNYSGIY